MTSYDILVIILSSFLAIFIALAIAATVLIIKLVNSVQGIVAKGEQLVDTAVEGAEEISETFRRNVGVVGLVKLLADFVNKDKK